MPLSSSGKKVLASMVKEYGSDKGKQVFYASMNKGNPGSGKWHMRAARLRAMHKGSK